MRARATRAAVISALAFSSACDPCSGIVGCSSDPHLGVTGRILNAASGLPERGAVVEFTRTAGAEIDPNPTRTTTDEQGSFTLTATAFSGDSVTGFFTIMPRSGDTYTIPDVHLPTFSRRGDTYAYRPWAAKARFPEGLRILLRGVPPVPATQLQFAFRRTGGVAVDGLVNGEFLGTTDTSGFSPFLGHLASHDVGDLVGDLVLYGGTDSLVHRDVHIAATMDFVLPIVRQDVRIGPSLEYHVKFLRRGVADESMAGVTVRFDRTGGISVSQPTWSETTGQGGSAVFHGQALDSGVVTGTLTITPPAPWKAFTRSGVQFKTFDADGAQVHSIIWVGPGLNGYARVLAQGAPLKGATVEFARTGGIPLISPVLTGPSDENGLALITAGTNDVGVVIGDLTIHPPPPYSTFTVRGVSITSMDGDDPPQRQVFGEWDASAPPALRAGARP